MQYLFIRSPGQQLESTALAGIKLNPEFGKHELPDAHPSLMSPGCLSNQQMLSGPKM